MFKESIASVWLVLSCVAQAQTDATAGEPPPPPPAEEADSMPQFSGSVSLRYESDYFFRGIAQRTDSINIQPAASLSLKVIESGDFGLSIVGGWWNDFSDDRAPGSVDTFREHWYEADLYAGFAFEMGRFTLTPIYTWYLSPSVDYTEYEDITITLGFNDAGLWDEAERFAINPWISLAIETNDAAAGPDSGVWLGLGIRPTIAFGDTPLGQFALAFPVGVGIGLDDYYQRADGSSDSFGYAEVGIAASFALGDRLGPAAPTIDFGVRHLWLDGMTEEANGGDDGEFVFTAGLTWSF
jgi:hypothetical protein